MRGSRTIILASTNADKLLEFKALLAPAEIEVVSASAMIANADKLAFVEVYNTYAENAAAKARFANHAAHYPCLADDSGVEIEHLKGAPGVRSARFAPPKPGMSQDRANVEKVLQDLKGVPMASRGARFVCTLCLCMEGLTIQSSGTLEGTILEAPQGTNGFGYDPIFMPKGQKKSFAELTSGEKNAISHRAQAVRSLVEQIRARGLSLARP